MENIKRDTSVTRSYGVQAAKISAVGVTMPDIIGQDEVNHVLDTFRGLVLRYDGFMDNVHPTLGDMVPSTVSDKIDFDTLGVHVVIEITAKLRFTLSDKDKIKFGNYVSGILLIMSTHFTDHLAMAALEDLEHPHACVGVDDIDSFESIHDSVAFGSPNLIASVASN